MPSKKQYNLVNDDAYDCRIPLYNEEAFQHGITFHAKYIGSLDVPRPTSRVEIVAAMRRIRYEFKAKSVKKKKVSLTISVDGVKVVIRDKRRSNQWPWDENKLVVMHHPIYRIFYVSHDSQDLKIFSYIARDGGTNAFKCNVFKSKKKNQAMRIVRTVGQAFEVCHKLSLALASSSAISDEIECSKLLDPSHKGDAASERNSCDTQVEELNLKQSDVIVPPSPQTTSTPITVATTTTTTAAAVDESKSMRKPENMQSQVSTFTSPSECTSNTIDSGPANFTHHIQLLHDNMEEQNQRIQTLTSQVQLLKDQLAVEASARQQLQAQNQHLLAYNRELLQHIAKLVEHFHELQQTYHVDGNSHIKLLPLPLPSSQAITGYDCGLPSILNSDRQDARNSPITTGRQDMKNSSKSQFQEHFREIAPMPSSDSNSPFSKQLSPPNVTFSSSPVSPCGGNRDPVVSGFSLPGSPSLRNLRTDSSHIFKYPSPLNSCLKQSRTQPSNKISDDCLPYVSENENKMPFESQGGSYRSTPSPGYNAVTEKNKKLQYSFNGNKNSPTFKYDNSECFPPLNRANDNYLSSSNSSQDPLFPTRHYVRDDWSVDSSAKNDSFIAQVTRDLAKIAPPVRELDSHLKQPNSQYSSLFNKS